MKCELCNKDKDLFIILPIKKESGELCTIACEQCAEQSEAYCTKHFTPHLAFANGTTACRACIDEISEANIEKCKPFMVQIKKSLHEEEYAELQNWLQYVTEITHQTEEKCLMRAIVTRAKITKSSIKNIFLQILAERSAESILPHSI